MFETLYYFGQGNYIGDTSCIEKSRSNSGPYPDVMVYPTQYAITFIDVFKNFKNLKSTINLLTRRVYYHNENRWADGEIGNYDKIILGLADEKNSYELSLLPVKKITNNNIIYVNFYNECLTIIEDVLEQSIVSFTNNTFNFVDEKTL